jgi:hypothetical protein
MLNSKRGFSATMLLAAIGGLAAAISGVNGHYRPDPQQTSKYSRSRIKGKRKQAGSKLHCITGRSPTVQGRILKAHFDQKGTNTSAKSNKVRASFGR